MAFSTPTNSQRYSRTRRFATLLLLEINMSITPEQFDRAFAEFQLFGPRRCFPIEERWREVLPDVESSELVTLRAQCEKIEALAFDLAEQVINKQIHEEAARLLIMQQYPFLTRERLDQTWSQAMHFALK